MRRRGIALFIVGALLVALAVFIDPLIDPALRGWAERTMNAKLKGYTVRIGRVRTHVWRLALGLEDLVLVQQAHPDPPVADIGALRFNVAWRDLVRLHVTGDLAIERPRLHIDLAHFESEEKSDVKLQDRGWQDAVEAVYPLRIDHLALTGGSFVYLAADRTAKPLSLTAIELSARDIRNVRADRNPFPSPVNLTAVLFDTGRVSFAGAADFLAKPRAAVRGDFRVAEVPLDRLDLLSKRWQLRTGGGALSAEGRVEVTNRGQTTHLREVRIDGLAVDYVTSPATKEAEAQHRHAAAEAAKSVSNEPRTLVQIDRLQLVNAQVGFVNRGSNPPYRLFFSKLDLAVGNLSNRFTSGPATYEATGLFMGSGRTTVRGAFRPEKDGADFDVHFRMEGAELASLNDLLRAYGKFDVAHGLVSLYTELSVKDGWVDGYIKPLFRDLKVYDRTQDRNKSVFKRLYEHVIQGLANLLKNRPREEVATVTPLRGRVSDPRASTWSVVMGLIENAFFDAILPGFERDASGSLTRK